MTPDPENAYRFVVNASLRILLGAAPLPRDADVETVNRPQVIKLAAYRSFEESFSLRVPVDEYSCYFSAPAATQVAPGRADDVSLFVEYAFADGIEVRESKVFEGAFEIMTSLPRTKIRQLHTAPQALSIDVRRRSDAFSRLLIGNECSPILPPRRTTVLD